MAYHDCARNAGNAYKMCSCDKIMIWVNNVQRLFSETVEHPYFQSASIALFKDEQFDFLI